MQKRSRLCNRQESLFFRHIAVLTYPELILLGLKCTFLPTKSQAIAANSCA